MSKINDDEFEGLLNNENENNRDDESPKQMPNGFADFMRTMMESLVNEDTNFSEKYGKPFSVEYSRDEKGHYIQKKIWKIDGGEVVEINGSRKPFKDGPQLSLEELLAEAIETENYEEAGRLRDEINKKDS